MNRFIGLFLLFALAVGGGVLMAIGITACSFESAEDRTERERIERVVAKEKAEYDRDVALGRRLPELNDSSPIGAWGNSGN